MNLTDLSITLPRTPIATMSAEMKIRYTCTDVLWDFPLISKEEFIEAVREQAALHRDPPEPTLVLQMAPAIWDNNRSFIPREFSNAHTPVWAIARWGTPVPYFAAERRKAKWIAANSYPEALGLLDPFILEQRIKSYKYVEDLVLAKGVTTGVLAISDGYGLAGGAFYKVYDSRGKLVAYVTAKIAGQWV